MNTEQYLLETWRKLPQILQQQVLDFMQFLLERRSAAPVSDVHAPSTELGTQLQAIRDQIVPSDTPLLTQQEIEQEVLERRGGYKE